MNESLYDLKDYIPLSDCKHGWLYAIRCRNLIMGVYREDRKGFVGIREKFGQQFLFMEYHWDNGEPLGTVKPLECLKRCPIENLNEQIKTPNGDFQDNKELFEWLKKTGGAPPAWVNQRKHLEDVELLLKARERQRKRLT